MAIFDALGLLIIVGGLMLVIWFTLGRDGRWPSSNGSNNRMLKEHARLTAKAAHASRKGHVGEANVYQESADHLAKVMEAEAAKAKRELPR